MKAMYQIWNYELINDGESYYINNKFKFDVITIDQDLTDKDLIKALKDQGILKKKLHFKSLRISGESEFTIYIDYKDKPLIELENLTDKGM